MDKSISYRRPDGKQAPGYLALPAAGQNAPAVVVVQEWWGLNEQIKGVADRLAAAGYRALVPDLFRGKMAADASEAQHMMSNLNFVDAADQDLRGAVQHLKSFAPTKVAVLGYCMGGALTIASGVRVAEVDAGVCFYGIPPREIADPARIRVPMLFHFGTRDDWCNPAAVEKLEARMKEGSVRYELYRYDAPHAFSNEKRPEVYTADAARLAWERSVEFLGRVLR